MNLDLTVVLSSLAGLFLLLGVGYGAVKGGVVEKSAAAPLSAVLLKIALPCVIFTSILQPFDPGFLVDSGIIVAVTGILFIMNVAISCLAAKLLRVREGTRGVWCTLTAFCNNGFMGFPVTLALLGEEGLALAAMICISFNLVLYPVSAYLIGRDVAGGTYTFSLKGVLLTPVNLAIVLGIFFYLTQLPVPDVILSPLRHLGNTTTPLSMFVVGMSLAGVNIRHIFAERDVLTATAMRLLILPALALILLGLIPFQNSLVPSVAFIILAMPAASIVTSLAETYGGDGALSSKVIFLTSLLCIVTIPFFCLFL